MSKGNVSISPLRHKFLILLSRKFLFFLTLTVVISCGAIISGKTINGSATYIDNKHSKEIRIAATDFQSFARKEDVRLLEMVQANPQETIPILDKAVHDHDASVRREAVRVLGKIRLDPSDCMSILTKAANDVDPSVRVEVVRVLGVIKPVSPDAMAILNQAVTDPFESVRLQTVNTLGKIDESSAVPALLVALADPAGESVSGGHGNTISKYNSTTRQWETEETWILSHNWICIRALESLGNLGSKAKSAVPTLIKLLKDNRTILLSKEIRKIYRNGKVEVNEKLNEIPFRLVVIRTLAKIGPEAKEAIPTLQEILDDMNEHNKKAVIDALNKIQAAQ